MSFRYFVNLSFVCTSDHFVCFFIRRRMQIIIQDGLWCRDNASVHWPNVDFQNSFALFVQIVSPCVSHSFCCFFLWLLFFISLRLKKKRRNVRRLLVFARFQFHLPPPKTMAIKVKTMIILFFSSFLVTSKIAYALMYRFEFVSKCFKCLMQKYRVNLKSSWFKMPK